MSAILAYIGIVTVLRGNIAVGALQSAARLLGDLCYVAQVVNRRMALQTIPGHEFYFLPLARE